MDVVRIFGTSNFVRRHELPNVGIPRLAQQLGEQSQPIVLIWSQESGAELVGGDILVPQEVGTKMPGV